jgi:hypothetical protein
MLQLPSLTSLRQKLSQILCSSMHLCLSLLILLKFRYKSCSDQDEVYTSSTSPTLRKSVEACELIKKINIVDLDYHIINGEGAGMYAGDTA